MYSYLNAAHFINNLAVSDGMPAPKWMMGLGTELQLKNVLSESRKNQYNAYIVKLVAICMQ
jgi:hypothetical protein